MKPWHLIGWVLLWIALGRLAWIMVDGMFDQDHWEYEHTFNAAVINGMLLLIGPVILGLGLAIYLIMGALAIPGWLLSGQLVPVLKKQYRKIKNHQQQRRDLRLQREQERREQIERDADEVLRWALDDGSSQRSA